MNAPRQAGFTMVELITVMILIGVLSAIAVPKLMKDNDTGAIVFGDQVASVLRTAQKTAVARRRIVCVTSSATSLTARISKARGTSTCDLALDAATASGKVTLAGAPAQLFFQPDGTVTTDAAGTLIAALELSVKHPDLPARIIRIAGSTGFVEWERKDK